MTVVSKVTNFFGVGPNIIFDNYEWEKSIFLNKITLCLKMASIVNNVFFAENLGELKEVEKTFKTGHIVRNFLFSSRVWKKQNWSSLRKVAVTISSFVMALFFPPGNFASSLVNSANKEDKFSPMLQSISKWFLTAYIELKTMAILSEKLQEGSGKEIFSTIAIGQLIALATFLIFHNPKKVLSYKLADRTFNYISRFVTFGNTAKAINKLLRGHYLGFIQAACKAICGYYKMGYKPVVNLIDKSKLVNVLDIKRMNLILFFYRHRKKGYEGK